ncbi:VWA domain-containing protein [Paenibacillus marchantiophytorum]|uniref:VWA domain-containing protein n=1 Tax=Paenibacillus marchantiophytorum TaxID=1619310 RepID=A0ABQ2BMT9_9BACL|nr:VWA domain-containing protein [Paenibacillus marchantiophytorum]GGI43392.1 VWA domain-containing protein [Paenibacillus marchantiophytorum]
MGILVDHWSILGLLLLLPIYIGWLWISLHRLQGARKKLAIGLRTFLLLLLVFALAGPQLTTGLHHKSIVFAVDRSDSVKQDGNEAAWIQAAAKARGSEKDEAGVVSMALQASIEKPVDSRPLDGFQMTAKSNPQFSNVASGLQLAAGLLPGDNTGRIILLSDGEENVGELLSQGKLLRDRGIRVDVVPLAGKERRDAAIEAVRLPEKLYQAEAYTVEVVIRSTASAPAQLRVFEDNREMTAQSVQLNKGENRFAFQSLAKEPGFHRYRAEVYLEGDEQSANNTHYGFSSVQGPPKVLIVEGTAGISKNVEGALQSALIPYETIVPELLSNDFVTYTGYQSILLNNVAATQIPQIKMEMIEQAVRDYSVGLVMLGGDNSYGLGGYFKTPIERALPVYMDLRGKREIPSLGIVLVMDKSGSMSGDKIKLAQEAASRTVDLLREKDTLGVLGFDGSPQWFVDPQKLTDKASVIQKINAIPADGGTEIYTAVEEAYAKLSKIDAQRKHIILLTDGQSSTTQSYEALTEQMQKGQITMSTVAIGTDADQALLSHLAELAKGRYYAAVDQTTIPAIFSREAVLISRTYVVNQPFVPAVTGGSDWSSFLGQGLPVLNGYIATTSKEAAEVVLASSEPDPILARWQYGSGRTVAWTSDATGAWSANWVTWPGFTHMLTSMIKWTFPQFEASPIELRTQLKGNELVLQATSGNQEWSGSAIQEELRVNVTDESLNKQEVAFTSTAPGSYSAQLPVDKSGVYLSKIELLASSGEADAEKRVVGSSTTGFVIPYSPEYRITDGQGLVKLQQLAELTGGRMLSLEHPEMAFAYAAAPQKRLTPIRAYLLMAALALLLLDIAARRLSLPPGLWARAFSRRAAAPASPLPLAQTPMARLRERKQLAEHKLQRTEAAAAKPRLIPEEPPTQAAAPTAAAEPAPPDGMSRLLEAKRRGRK